MIVGRYQHTKHTVIAIHYIHRHHTQTTNPSSPPQPATTSFLPVTPLKQATVKKLGKDSQPRPRSLTTSTFTSLFFPYQNGPKRAAVDSGGGTVSVGQQSVGQTALTPFWFQCAERVRRTLRGDEDGVTAKDRSLVILSCFASRLFPSPCSRLSKGQQSLSTSK